MTIWLLIELVGACIALYCMFTDGDFFIGIIGCVLTFLGFYLHQRKLATQKEIGRVKEQCVKFYEMCTEMNILDSNKESNRAKMRKIAKSLYGSAYSFYNNDVEKMIKIAKTEIATKIENERNEKIQKQKDDEKKQHEELTKYSESIGNKREMMLMDICIKYKQDADALEKGVQAVVASSQMKEKDWAIAGGIADGIAGAGAGIATALNVQAENERIRQQNKTNMELVKPFVYQAFDAERELNKKFDVANELYKECIVKLSDTTIDEDELLSKLKLKVLSSEVSEDTNTLTIEVSVEKCKKFAIYDDVEAIVDGTISADIYQGNKKVGSALLVLPLDGTLNKSIVKGMCLYEVDASKPYDIKFTPYHLWAMEI